LAHRLGRMRASGKIVTALQKVDACGRTLPQPDRSLDRVCTHALEETMYELVEIVFLMARGGKRGLCAQRAGVAKAAAKWGTTCARLAVCGRGEPDCWLVAVNIVNVCILRRRREAALLCGRASANSRAVRAAAVLSDAAEQQRFCPEVAE
jgi:hypothetical protein